MAEMMVEKDVWKAVTMALRTVVMLVQKMGQMLVVVLVELLATMLVGR